MEQTVWALKHVKLEHRDVIVILLTWNQFSNKMNDEIKKHTEKFGQLMTYKGVLVMPYEDRMADALSEVLSKGWDEDLKTRMMDQQYPFLLIINRDFEAFNPKADKFAFVWFSDLKGQEENIWQIFDTIAQKVSRKEDIFDYLAKAAEQEKEGKLTDRLAGLSKYAEIRIPIIPGVISLNAGAVWAAIVSRGGKSSPSL
jgi:hypothetical protein